MSDKLEQLADAVRAAVSAGNFGGAQAAFNTYANEVRRTANGTTDRTSLTALESDWKDLAAWTRSMALTARALARDEWVRLPAACPYRAPAAPQPSTINARG